jgi:hypothetical protein
MVKLELVAIACVFWTLPFFTTSLKGAPPMTPTERDCALAAATLRIEIRVSLRIYIHSTLRKCATLRPNCAAQKTSGHWTFWKNKAGR